ncbi:hypothetical protein G5S33_01843 [Staphylococcus cohnii subsp. cohnii]|uniref:hypothetical protein n=1 Tax=Staphylococcus cohnii TaxID=29382 RepID=UPI001F3EBCB6|nr:hypothetical protein [Staphylococcus cohnii]MBB2508415.1 hypothetical protein [Staphylococcus cohnii subsp. barensis]
MATKAVNEREILTLAYEMILNGANVFSGSFVWIEYEDVDRLRDFYKSFGFTYIEEHTSENELKIAILKI